jgi:DNA-binding MarR family transcriptional regulator
MKGLECRQLVRRERSPESDREVLAWLTPAGQELFERVYPVHYRFLQERFGSRLSDAEQEALIALLRQLVVSR